MRLSETILHLVAAVRLRLGRPLSRAQFQPMMQHVVSRFPLSFPALWFSPYSKRLEELLGTWLGYGIDVVLFRHRSALDISTELATTLLRRLKRSHPAAATRIEAMADAAIDWLQTLT